MDLLANIYMEVLRHVAHVESRLQLRRRRPHAHEPSLSCIGTACMAAHMCSHVHARNLPVRLRCDRETLLIQKFRVRE